MGSRMSFDQRFRSNLFTISTPAANVIFKFYSSIAILNSDWLKIVMGLGTANQIALFQLLLNLFMTPAPGVFSIESF